MHQCSNNVNLTLNNVTKPDVGFSTLHNVDTMLEHDVETTLCNVDSSVFPTLYIVVSTFLQRRHDIISTMFQLGFNVS